MTLTKISIALAISLAFSGAAAAHDAVALPKDLPPYAPDKPLPVPQIEKKTLANGLEVWVVPRNGLPRVDYVLAVRDAGLAADAPTASGYAGLLAGLLSEGTAKRDSKAIAETAQRLGGIIGASASNDGLTLYADALASHAAPMLDLLADVAREPAFPANEVKLAQANAAEELKANEALPAFKASRALLQAVYGDHPYARTQPTESTIAALTPENLRAEHARRFRPDRALLVVAGKVTGAEGFALAEKAFGDWKAVGADAPDAPAAPRQAKPQHVMVQRDGSVQSTLRIGRPAISATDPEYIPLLLASRVLGGGWSSRLFLNLRQDKGYTYGAYAYLSAARAGGNSAARADVRNEVTGASLKEFFHEFERLGNEPLTAKELEDAKRSAVGDYLIDNQMQGTLAYALASNWLIGLPSGFLGEYVPKIRAVDAAQVQAMAKKYYSPKDQSIVVVGDGKAIAEQLKTYGNFETRDK